MADRADLSPEDADAAAMAAAMGFSNFGAQKPNKRRKYNPHVDDAVVDAPSASSSLPFHKPAKGTSANAIPLGTRPTANKDEISLEDEGDDIGDQGDGKDPTPQAENPSLHHQLPSRPPVNLPTHDEVQSKIETILGTSSIHNQPSPTSSSFHQGGRGGGVGGHGARGGCQSSAGRGKHPRESTGTPWWEEYYDPAFNTNPWEKLEKERGLEPRGPWMTWEESKAAATT